MMINVDSALLINKDANENDKMVFSYIRFGKG